MRRALARSRGEARDLVLAGSVRVGGSTVTKPSHPVGDGDELTVTTRLEAVVSASSIENGMEIVGVFTVVT